MASAFKCDRCGKLYSEPDTSTKIGKGSNTYISNLWIGNGNWDTGAKDICPDCARDFLVWWEYSNISAQYELQKIKDNLRANADEAKNMYYESTTFAASNTIKTLDGKEQNI